MGKLTGQCCANLEQMQIWVQGVNIVTKRVVAVNWIVTQHLGSALHVLIMEICQSVKLRSRSVLPTHSVPCLGRLRAA